MNAHDFRPCIVIPVYNHEGAIGRVLPALFSHQLPIILVDDGSQSSCQQELEKLTRQHSSLILIRLEENQGKGGAVKAGLIKALHLGFSHALQIDADGQHCSDDISRFVELGEKSPDSIICGVPIYDKSVPKVRYYARYLTHIWIWINTLSLKIQDSMCGFRLYPLQATTNLIESTAMGNRMDFDPEFLVHWVWHNGDIVNTPTQVSYPIDGVSHFAPWRDNYLISKMHAKLFFLMLTKAPHLVARKMSRKEVTNA